MRKIVAAGMLAVAFIVPGCSDPADSPECKKWQSDYEQTRMLDGTYTDALGNEKTSNTGAILRAALLKERPDGCQIP